MARIVVLANSKRPDGHCLAGIDLDTGEWVRPVPSRGDGIPTARCIVNGKLIALRDVLELDLTRPRIIAEFQRENQIIRNWNWKVKGRLSLDALRKYVESASPILHTASDRVNPKFLKARPTTDWKSLQLISPVNLHFSHHYFDANRWVANFRDRAGNPYSFKITDADANRRLEAGRSIRDASLLTISLTKPWSHSPDEKPPMCYKLVAAVIEM